MLAANLAAFRAGRNFGETAELFDNPYEVAPAPLRSGTYRNVIGNLALSYGLVVAAQKAKLPLVYCVVGLGSGKPQSHAGVRRSACEAKRWIASTVSDADAAMNRKISSPLYELRAVSIGTMDSQATPSCVGIVAPVSI